jgi:hypothetical protein
MAFSLLGCAGVDDEGGGAAASAICAPAQSECTGDTICGQAGCEPAFDRRYQVRVAGVWLSGKGFDRCLENVNCSRADVTVYFSDADAPIIGSGSAPPVAEILISQGSYLLIEMGDADCIIDLTAERLRSRSARCGDQTRAALVTLHPLPE